MTDQADKLRSLVETSSLDADVASEGVPMVVVAGARGGLGATTVAVNLAAVMADRGERVLLVDGSQRRSAVLEPAGVRTDSAHTFADVLSGKCAIRDAIVQGPVGVRMLLNRWQARSSPDFSRQAQQRLWSELQSLDGEFDLIVVDTGRGLSAWSQRFWSRAKATILVTTVEDGSVLDAYATFKASVEQGVHAPVRLLVNQAGSDDEASGTYRRIENACQRFLSRSIPALPALPRHMVNEFAIGHVAPRVWEMPNTPFGHAALWLGRAIEDLVRSEPEKRAPLLAIPK